MKEVASTSRRKTQDLEGALQPAESVELSQRNLRRDEVYVLALEKAMVAYVSRLAEPEPTPVADYGNAQIDETLTG